MGTLTLHPLTSNLLAAALTLDQRCFGGMWTADGYQREIDSPNSDLLIIQNSKVLATPGEKNSSQSNLLTNSPLLALGCSWAILDEAHITLLAVDPDYQQQGVGQALLYKLLVAACDRGLQRATLEVRASNQAALALYRKFGFREAGRRKRYYQDNGEDALVLWRGGLQHPQFAAELAEWRQWVGDRLARSGWQLDGECGKAEV